MFNSISQDYSKCHLSQMTAGLLLFDKLKIYIPNADILDIGTGKGDFLTLFKENGSRSISVLDNSSNFIEYVKANYSFLKKCYCLNAEEMTFNSEYDILFCNSVFMWLKREVIGKFYKALRKNGIFSLQAPYSKSYCPTFDSLYSELLQNRITKKIFQSYREPIKLYSRDEYIRMFNAYSFEIFDIETINTEVKMSKLEFENYFFSSAPAVLYLNLNNYRIKPTQEYFSELKNIFHKVYFYDEIYSETIFCWSLSV